MENKKESSEGEDIPSDFFDDFNKEEFIEGLSVIDSWNDEDKQPVSARARINAEALDSVRDLRELIAKESHDGKRDNDRYQKRTISKRMLYLSDQKRSIERKHEGSTSHLDDYIKPGSRRDRTKTNEAIKKDKEEKVKEYLAKHLESSDDICPPGTELDDFLEEKRSVEITKKKLVATISNNVSPPKKLEPSPPKRRRETPGKRRESTGTRRESPGRFHESPGRYRESPGRRHFSPERRRESPGRRRESPGRRRESPGRRRESPGRRRESPGRRRHSPGKRHESPLRRREFSPRFRRVQWSPRRQYQTPRQSYRQFSPLRNRRHQQRISPLRSPEIHHDHHSRSPYKRPLRRSRSRSVHRLERRDRSVRRSLSGSPNHKPKKDDFLYPKEYFPPPTEFPVETEMPYQVAPSAAPPYTEPMPVEYVAPNYAYGPGGGPAYSGYGAPYDYGIQPASMPLPVPQPVPAPIIITPGPAVPVLGQQPTIVPAPQHIVSPAPNLPTHHHQLPQPFQNTPVDALAKLVADGKLSHEDYLKLAPNKGVNQSMDTQARVAVLNRCHNAMSKLGTIGLPNRLIMNNNVVGPELKQIVPKFCSPLKRQVASEFYFTKFNSSVIARQNKQIVESLISTLGLQDVVGKQKKKPQRDTKEVAVQTMKSSCEMCEIRASTKYSEAETITDRGQFTSTVHTQVLEQDLLSSKSTFNPTGATEGANMSIAHMTPAQLVSQLAARAKTLKQSEAPPSQYRHDNRYDYEGRGDQYRYYNYRY